MIENLTVEERKALFKQLRSEFVSRGRPRTQHRLLDTVLEKYSIKNDAQLS